MGRGLVMQTERNFAAEGAGESLETARRAQTTQRRI
jgi:hypothetical protein